MNCMVQPAPAALPDPDASAWVREVMGIAKALCADEGKDWDAIDGLDKDRFGRAACVEVMRRQDAGLSHAEKT